MGPKRHEVSGIVCERVHRTNDETEGSIWNRRNFCLGIDDTGNSIGVTVVSRIVCHHELFIPTLFFPSFFSLSFPLFLVHKIDKII